jgi:translation initiation factor IF-3
MGREMFERFLEDVGECGTLENKPNMEGNSMTMLIAPTVAKGDKVQ